MKVSIRLKMDGVVAVAFFSLRPRAGVLFSVNTRKVHRPSSVFCVHHRERERERERDRQTGREGESGGRKKGGENSG